MSPNHLKDDDHIHELLIKRPTSGLSEAEQQEFEQLVSRPEYREEARRFELTAAAMSLAFGNSQLKEMPREIHHRLLIAAGKFFGYE